MGICNSCESSTSVATAKLILEDGRLEEFSYPARVWQILQKKPGYFICNADDMGFDHCVSAISDDENLHIGQLYFVLPSSWLNNPLTVQQMAALAVKASLALKMGGGGGKRCWCRRKREDSFEFFSKSVPDQEASPMVAIGVVGGGFSGGFVAKRRVSGGSRHREMTSSTKLSVILEEQGDGNMVS